MSTAGPTARGRVLVAAGSDSGGGAGIQADIKTITALGGYAATAITAITVQDTLGAHDVFDIPPAIVESQMRVVLADIGADAIKSGMLQNADIIAAVAQVIEDLGKNIPYVLDPVMVAKGGAPLIDASAVSLLTKRLLPLASVVTPNVPEAEALTGKNIKTLEDMKACAQILGDQSGAAVLLKGGHLSGDDVHDVFFYNGVHKIMTSPRIDTKHTHGTGCTLASAVAAYLAQGLKLEDAVTRARDYVQDAISHAPGFGQGHGPLGHGFAFISRAN